MNLSLTPELEQFIQKQVDLGAYSNANEVICEALRRMDEEDKWEGLRDFLAPRIAAVEAGNYSTKSIEEILDSMKNK